MKINTVFNFLRFLYPNCFFNFDFNCCNELDLVGEQKCFGNKSRVFLLRQLLIVNYYVKKSQYENINTLCFQRNDITEIVHFGILIHILS